MALPALYKRDANGVIRVWQVKVENDIIVRTWGQEGGKLQRSRRRAAEKRLTAQQEAESLWKQQVDKGYTTTLKEGPTEKPPLPMLAQPYKSIQGVWLAQPKLDGVRIVVSAKGVFSRTGKRASNMDHILKGLTLPDGWWLDGEAYDSTLPFEDITSAFHKEGSPVKLHMWVFDVIGPGTCRERLDWIETWKPPNEYFNKVPWMPCNITNVRGTHDKMVSLGFEGLILRDPSQEYQIGKRSRGLLKMKHFQDAEYEIVGKMEDVDGGVIWVCTTLKGDTFKVRPRGARGQRQQWAQEDHRGKMLTVRYQELTKLGVPRFPVGIGLRDYE